MFQAFDPRLCGLSSHIRETRHGTCVWQKLQNLDEERLGFNVQYIARRHVVLHHERGREVVDRLFPSTKQGQCHRVIVWALDLCWRFAQLENHLT